MKVEGIKGGLHDELLNMSLQVMHLINWFRGYIK